MARPQRRWTDDDVAVLRDLHEKLGLSCDEIATMLDRTAASVSNKASRLGLQHGSKWSNEQVAAITSDYEDVGRSVADIARDVGKSVHAVTWKAVDLGLSRSLEWSVDEDSLLGRLYPDRSVSRKEIQQSIPNRTWKSIVSRANSKGLLRCRYRYTIRSHYFDEIDAASKAYALGLMAADGYVTRHHGVGLKLKSSDGVLVRWLANEISDDDICRPVIGRNQIGFEVADEHMHAALSAYGIVPNKTKSLCWPDLLPEHYAIPFIAGLFDGDGCLSWCKDPTSKARGYWSWTQLGTAELLDGVRQSLSHHLGFDIHTPRRMGTANVFLIKLSGRKAVAADSALDALPFGLRRKRISSHPARLMATGSDDPKDVECGYVGR